MNSSSKSWWSELPRTLHLALPMMAGFAGGYLMHIIDMAMVGRAFGEEDAVPLAALGFGGNLVMLFATAGYGIIGVLLVLSSQRIGQGRAETSGDVLEHGLLLSVIFGVGVGLIFQLGYDPMMPVLVDLMGQPEEVVAEARNYTVLYGWAYLPILLYGCFRAFSDSHHRPWLPLAVLCSGLVLNVFLNWILIFGELGLPAYGVTGAGIATLIAQAYLFVAMAVVMCALPSFPVGFDFVRFRHLRWGSIRHYSGLAIPSSLTIFVEVSAWVVAGIFIGPLGPEAMAAHHVAFKVSTFTFMIPLGAALATSVRVGNAYGREDMAAVRRITLGSVIFGGTIALFWAAIYFGLGEPLARLFTESEEVVRIAVWVFLVIGVFQVLDATQLIILNALRGIHDVQWPFAIVTGVYWILGLPLAYVLIYPVGWGVVGLWVALASVLALAAILMPLRFILLSKVKAAEFAASKPENLER